MIEAVRSAVTALSADRSRSALMACGVGVGVATVMFIAALSDGMGRAISGEFEATGARNFAVWRFDPDQIQSGGNWADIWAGRPRLSPTEGEAVREVPSVLAASVFVQRENTGVSLGAEVADGVHVYGVDAEWTRFAPGDLVAGRVALPLEDRASAGVVVLSEPLADALAGGGEVEGLIGEPMRVGTQRVRIIGVYREREGPFGTLSGEALWVPSGFAVRRLGADPDFLRINVAPVPGPSGEWADADVREALRTHRGLRPAEADGFVLKTNSDAAAADAQWVQTLSLVLMGLASVGFAVSGVGIVAVMTISVTERTREVGVRRALGARRADIALQFLAESVLVTFGGGALGVVLGTLSALVLSAVTPLPAAIPIKTALIGFVFLTAAGVGFGLRPALRAAFQDPTEALRFE